MLSSSLFRRAHAVQPMASRAFSTSQRASLARMQVLGRLAAEPELVNTSTGRDLVRYSIASNYGPKENRQTSWFRVACFHEGPTRDLLLSLQKGSQIFVEADARMTEYQDADGKNRQGLTLVQRNFEVIARPRSAGDATGDATGEIGTAEALSG